MFRQTVSLSAIRIFLVALVLACAPTIGAQQTFLRGDCNDDGVFNFFDSIDLARYLFLGSTAPSCLKACDTDDSGTQGLVDVVYGLNALFLGTAPPPPPNINCGIDPTPDLLTCVGPLSTCIALAPSASPFPAQLVALEDVPETVVVADFNNDSVNDVAASTAANEIQIFLGRGDGTFLIPTTTALITTAEVLVTEDLNSDGNIDIAALAPSASLVLVALGNGDGTLQPPTSFSVAPFPSNLVAANLNNDGVVDFVSSSATSNNVAIVTGIGGGLFSVQTLALSFDIGPHLAVADFDGDTLDDFVVDTDTRSFTLFSNDGAGTFSPGLTTSTGITPGDTLSGLMAGDFDNDSVEDFAAIDSEGSVRVFLGSTTNDPIGPFFSSGNVTSVGHIIADVNDDGNLDIIHADTLQIHAGVGDGTFSFLPLNFECGGVAQALADLNGDGVLDVVLRRGTNIDLTRGIVTCFGSDTSIFLALRQFVEPQTEPRNTALGDFDGDGDLEIVTSGRAGANGVVRVRFGNGTGSFSAASDVEIGSRPSHVTPADFNGDSDLDIAVIDRDLGRVFLLLGNGSGDFAVGGDFPLGVSFATNAMAGGDFDNDGDIDLAVFEPGESVMVLLNQGNATLIAAPSQPLNLPPQDLLTADFNNDGNLDLLALTGTVVASVLLGNGDGTLSQPQSFPLSPNSRNIGIGDLDQDGNLDLVVAVRGAASVELALFLGNGTATFSQQPPVAIANQATIRPGLTIGDFNRDGIEEVVVTHTGRLARYQLNATGSFDSQTFVAVGTTPPRNLISGDMNGDGALDIVTNHGYVYLSQD